MSKVEVLFFGADPLSAGGRRPALDLAAEAEKIEMEVEAAPHGNRIHFDTCWATRIQDLRQSLLTVKPNVVHFSGHGGEGGLVLVSSDGHGSHRVNSKALQQFFKAYRKQIRLVVLNACNSQPQAQAIADVVGCAIGTPTKILDEAAIGFSAAFYSSIASGESVKAALEQARATLRMEGFAEHELPVLLKKAGVDPSKLVLVQPERARLPRLISRIGAGAGLAWGLVIATTIGEPQPPRDSVCAQVQAVMPAPSGVIQPLAGMSEKDAPVEPSRGELSEVNTLHQAGKHATEFALIEKAAAAGNKEATGLLGVALLYGDGTLKDTVRGIELLREAAGAGDLASMLALALAYERGDGVRRSHYRARQWYENAANKKGSGKAMRNLGNFYRDGLGVHANGTNALDWYLKSIRTGIADAAAEAGFMYERGGVVPANTDEAICLYQSAAEAGSALGMYAMGRMYQTGTGVDQDYGKAAKFYLDGAAAGSIEAMNALGILYLEGAGVNRDTAEAIRQFRKATRAGSTVAAERLSELGAS